MKVGLVMSLASIFSALMSCCGIVGREVVPRAEFRKWVEEEYLKEGIDLKESDVIIMKAAPPIARLPKQKGLVYRDYRIRLHLYGETDLKRRARVISALRERASSALAHEAEIRFYSRYNEEGDSRLIHVEEF